MKRAVVFRASPAKSKLFLQMRMPLSRAFWVQNIPESSVGTCISILLGLFYLNRGKKSTT